MEKYPRMNLEFEKTFDRVIYPDNAKSYAYIKKSEIVVKGPPFNCYTMDYRAELLQFFRKILETEEKEDGKYKEEKQEICNKFMCEKRNQIFEIIENRDVDALRKFARIVKLGKAKTKVGNLTLTGHLEQTYPNIENYNTIPFNCHENKTFCVMPIELIT